MPGVGSESSSTETQKGEAGAGRRAVNVALASVLALRCLTAWQTDADWWLWVPVYAAGLVMCACVALRPTSGSCPMWRYLTALVIVLGSMYLLFTVWVVYDVRQGYLPRDDVLMEGRELVLLAFVVAAGVLNRLAAPAPWTVLSGLRMVFLLAVLFFCINVLAYSACFYGLGDHLPYCKLTCPIWNFFLNLKE